MPYRHELDLHVADEATTNQRPQKTQQNVIVVFADSVIYGEHQAVDVRLSPRREMFIQQAGNCHVKGCTDEVAPCVSDRRYNMHGIVIDV